MEFFLKINFVKSKLTTINNPFCLLNTEIIKPKINKYFFFFKNDKITNCVEIKKITSSNRVGIDIKNLNKYGLNKTIQKEINLMFSDISKFLKFDLINK